MVTVQRTELVGWDTQGTPETSDDVAIYRIVEYEVPDSASADTYRPSPDAVRIVGEFADTNANGLLDEAQLETLFMAGELTSEADYISADAALGMMRGAADVAGHLAAILRGGYSESLFALLDQNRHLMPQVFEELRRMAGFEDLTPERLEELLLTNFGNLNIRAGDRDLGDLRIEALVRSIPFLHPDEDHDMRFAEYLSYEIGIAYYNGNSDRIARAIGLAEEHRTRMPGVYRSIADTLHGLGWSPIAASTELQATYESDPVRWLGAAMAYGLPLNLDDRDPALSLSVLATITGDSELMEERIRQEHVVPLETALSSGDAEALLTALNQIPFEDLAGVLAAFSPPLTSQIEAAFGSGPLSDTVAAALGSLPFPSAELTAIHRAYALARVLAGSGERYNQAMAILADATPAVREALVRLYQEINGEALTAAIDRTFGAGSGEALRLSYVVQNGYTPGFEIYAAPAETNGFGAFTSGDNERVQAALMSAAGDQAALDQLALDWASASGRTFAGAAEARSALADHVEQTFGGQLGVYARYVLSPTAPSNLGELRELLGDVYDYERDASFNNLVSGALSSAEAGQLDQSYGELTSLLDTISDPPTDAETQQLAMAVYRFLRDVEAFQVARGSVAQGARVMLPIAAMLLAAFFTGGASIPVQAAAMAAAGGASAFFANSLENRGDLGQMFAETGTGAAAGALAVLGPFGRSLAGMGLNNVLSGGITTFLTAVATNIGEGRTIEDAIARAMQAAVMQAPIDFVLGAAFSVLGRAGRDAFGTPDFRLSSDGQSAVVRLEDGRSIAFVYEEGGVRVTATDADGGSIGSANLDVENGAFRLTSTVSDDLARTLRDLGFVDLGSDAVAAIYQRTMSATNYASLDDASRRMLSAYNVRSPDWILSQPGNTLTSAQARAIADDLLHVWQQSIGSGMSPEDAFRAGRISAQEYVLWSSRTSSVADMQSVMMLDDERLRNLLDRNRGRPLGAVRELTATNGVLDDGVDISPLADYAARNGLELKVWVLNNGNRAIVLTRDGNIAVDFTYHLRADGSLAAHLPGTAAGQPRLQRALWNQFQEVIRATNPSTIVLNTPTQELGVLLDALGFAHDGGFVYRLAPTQRWRDVFSDWDRVLETVRAYRDHLAANPGEAWDVWSFVDDRGW